MTGGGPWFSHGRGLERKETAMRRCFATLALSAVLVICCRPAAGQASFGESFDAVGATAAGQDGPQNLINAGWAFRNQSNSRGSTVWRQGTWLNDSIAPNAGAGYLASNADWDA